MQGGMEAILAWASKVRGVVRAPEGKLRGLRRFGLEEVGGAGGE